MKWIKTFRILAVALTLALLATALPATPALAEATLYVTPSQGKIGAEFEVYGSGFDAGVHYNIYFSRERVAVGEDIDTDVINYELLGKVIVIGGGTFVNYYYKVPSKLTDGDVEEKVRGGTYYLYATYATYSDTKKIRARATFTVESTSEITLSPGNGVVGANVTVTGNGFGSRESITVKYGNKAVNIKSGDNVTDSNGDFELAILIPESTAGKHTITVTGADSAIGAEAEFTVKPEITISPESGVVGDKVVVNGTGFQANKSVTIAFGNENVATSPASATTNSTGGFSVSFTVPVRITGTFKVKAFDGTNTVEADFSIVTSASVIPETSAALPGHVGTGLTVSGVGFMAGTTVTVTYDGNQVAIAPVNADGTFSATFNAPASSGGKHTIIATDGTNTQNLSFFMESDAPSTPVPLKPEMGIKAKTKAYFDWQEVTDPSGVTYTLQIATDENFSQASMILEKTGLTQSEYTITRAERLVSGGEEAPYYWHVKAVDGASNESQWTGTGRFYVGGFSLGLSQSVIYVLFGVGALLLGLFGFWLGRKTAYY